MAERFDLSAALEDAEGKALVQNIITRKEVTLRLNAPPLLRVWNDRLGEWQDAGFSSVTFTPEEDLFLEKATLTPTKLAAQVEMTVQDVSYDFMALMLGYSSVAEMQQAAEKRRQLAALAGSWLKTGRGHGKGRAQAEWIRHRSSFGKGRQVVSDFLAGLSGQPQPWAASITWFCPKPTD